MGESFLAQQYACYLQQEEIEFSNKTEKTGILLEPESCFLHFHSAMIFNIYKMF